MSACDNSISWRELTDQLTPWQIAELERWEQKWPDEAKGLLVEARSYAEQNLDTQLVFGGVDAPEGARRVYLAQQGRDGTWFREFTGTSRHVAGVSVSIDGEQYPDGSAKRTLSIGVDEFRSGGELSVEQAREFAAAVAEAADELERLR